MKEKENKNYTINENGSIVVHNYCAAELPQITVTRGIASASSSAWPGLFSMSFTLYFLFARESAR